MQQPPSGQDWPQQGQPPYGYGQPSQPLPPNTQWGQQAPSPYPPQQDQWQQPYGQPPPNWQPQQPPKKSRKGLWIVLGIVAAVVVFGCIGISAVISQASKSVSTAANNAQATVTNAQATINAAETQLPTSVPTQVSTQPASGGKWTTVQTFTGNGNKKTAIFNTPDDWKIIWSCQGFTDGSGIDGELTVTVYDNTNNAVDIAAVNSSCKAGGTSKGDTEEHQGGSVYLDIGATGNWTIQIQELK